MRLPLTLFILLILSAPSISWAQAVAEVGKSHEKKVEFAEGIDLEANEFKNETRIGATISSGNTGSVAITGNNVTKYRIRRYENSIRAGAHYNRITSVTGATAPGTVARYIFGSYRLDYYFLPKTTVYGGGGGYTDEIKGISKAGQGFTGLTHYLLREKARDLGGSVGYDFTLEDRLPPLANEAIHSGTAGIIYRQDLNEIVTLAEKLDLQENVQNGRDLRLQNQADLKVKLSDHLSLAVGFNLRFDNQPVPGFKKLDTLSDLALLVSF